MIKIVIIDNYDSFTYNLSHLVKELGADVTVYRNDQFKLPELEAFDQLTEAVRRKPYSVVLFDEIEKAHPDVFNTLLQVLDDGRLTDNKGRVVNFKNTIIIMTSNASREMLKKTFRPEFLNRIDDIITFQPLTKDQIAKVVELQMNRAKKMLEPQGFDLRWTPAAIGYLAEVGYDPEFGARPVKRAIQDYVLNDLSKKILAEEVSREKPITIDYSEANGIEFKNL